MSGDLLYQIALTLVPHIGDVHAKALVNIYGDAQSIFKAKKKELDHMEGIGTVRARSIKEFTDFSRAEEEIKFIEKYKIIPLFINAENYPKRLLNCYDSPALLYYRGNADLNTSRIISVVGTRNNSDYGKIVCEKMIEELQAENVLVVSGLAFGIDTIAHKAALKHNLQTIAVLAHGLDRIYPTQNKTLAKQITEQGGLLTEFISNTNPDKQNFPKRNRIVAGICDAVIVIEQIHKAREEHPDEKLSGIVGHSLRYLLPAMIGSSLSTIVIFIPFALMSGVAGAYFQVLAFSMIIALTVSFFVSWLLLPVLYTFFPLQEE